MLCAGCLTWLQLPDEPLQAIRRYLGPLGVEACIVAQWIGFTNPFEDLDLRGHCDGAVARRDDELLDSFRVTGGIRKLRIGALTICARAAGADTVR